MRVSAFKSNARPINRLFVIIPAAGIGSRMNSTENKQFIKVAGIPIIERTLSAFDVFSNRQNARGSFSIQTVVVVAEEQIFKVKRICEDRKFNFVKSIVPGGETRQDSVWNGIVALSSLPFPPGEDDVVFIHDGARCMIDQDTLDRLLKAAAVYNVCAAAVPVKNTIKQTEGPQSAAVLTTPDRSTLQEIQTPQVFRYSVLVEAYSSAMRRGRTATDDTALAEAIGERVQLVEGAYSNIKITTLEDLQLAEVMLNNPKGAEQK